MQKLIKQTVTRNTDSGTATVAKVSTTDTQTQTVASTIYFIFGLIEVALAFHFILKLTGANAGTGFVSGVYGITQLLIMPFRRIFPSAVGEGVASRAAFEPATLVAMLVYAVLAWGIVKLIAIMAGHSNEEL